MSVINLNIQKSNEISNEKEVTKICKYGQRVRNYYGDAFLKEVIEYLKKNDHVLNYLNYKERKLILDAFKRKRVDLIDLFSIKNKIKETFNKISTEKVDLDQDQPTRIIERVINLFYRTIYFFNQSDSDIKDLILSEKDKIAKIKKLYKTNTLDETKKSSNLEDNVNQLENNVKPVNSDIPNIRIAPYSDIFKIDADFKVVAGSQTLHSSPQHSSPGGLAGAFNEALKKTKDKKGWHSFQGALRNFVSQKIDNSKAEWIPQKQSWLSKKFDKEVTPKVNYDENITCLSYLDANNLDQKLIFAVGPRYPEDPDTAKGMDIPAGKIITNLDKTNAELKSCYKEILKTVSKEANREKVTVAIPLMSAGLFKYPPELSIKIAYEAIHEYQAETSPENRVAMDIIICAKDKTESELLITHHKNELKEQQTKRIEQLGSTLVNLCKSLGSYTGMNLSSDEVNYLFGTKKLPPNDFDRALEELNRFRENSHSQHQIDNISFTTQQNSLRTVDPNSNETSYPSDNLSLLERMTPTRKATRTAPVVSSFSYSESSTPRNSEHTTLAESIMSQRKNPGEPVDYSQVSKKNYKIEE